MAVLLGGGLAVVSVGGVFTFTSLEVDDVIERGQDVLSSGGDMLEGGGSGGNTTNKMATATPTETPTPDELPTPDLSPNIPEVESRFDQLLNDHRQDANVGILTNDLPLGRAAREHAEDMAERDFFDHVNPDGETVAERYSHLCLSPGENIAQTYWRTEVTDVDGSTYINETEEELAENIFELWLTSPAHRENMELHRWSSHGIGVVFDTSTYAVYAVNAFC